jgi:hypothetical protein
LSHHQLRIPSKMALRKQPGSYRICCWGYFLDPAFLDSGFFGWVGFFGILIGCSTPSSRSASSEVLFLPLVFTSLVVAFALRKLTCASVFSSTPRTFARPVVQSRGFFAFHPFLLKAISCVLSPSPMVSVILMSAIPGRGVGKPPVLI